MSYGHEHEQVLQSEQGQEMLGNVRRITRELPEASEVIDGFGHTSFRIRNKSFVILGGDLPRGPIMSIKATKETQTFLLEGEGQFWKTPYVGQHGWVSTTAAVTGCWAELAPLIIEAYCLAAPKTLAKQVMART